ncbi:hypothetical protein [Marinifilum caeruleilacunae]|uniref:NigD-like C-terminal beta sandwich domain-containing protein n=1 Tax=Marinifilum caeruleilacunae TaxID=2499076 RepID=A0ABX1WXT8_9BACT|nr:hypothetical protein [Marinifilum caeruleilacunae]NOU60940.1 hypothetical protein [Marinifilum caeruleilacunae]
MMQEKLLKNLMMNKAIVFFSFIILLMSCQEGEDVILKYDYAGKSVLSSNIKYYSIVQNITDSVVIKSYYVGLDSTNTISKELNFQIFEKYNDTEHFLYGAIQLKKDKGCIGAKWRSSREDIQYDSLDVSLIGVVDTIFSNVRVNDCYIFDIKYDNNSDEDLSDYRIYFDFRSKAVLKKIYYRNQKIKGVEEIIRVTPANANSDYLEVLHMKEKDHHFK